VSSLAGIIKSRCLLDDIEARSIAHDPRHTSVTRPSLRLLHWTAIDHNAAEAAGIWDWAGATFMGKIPEALHLFGERA
jgi:hypothetical protein